MQLGSGTRAAIPALVVALLAAGCVQWAVEEEVTFRPDGSGSARVSFGFEKQGASLMGIRDRMEQELRRQLPGEAQVRTREDARWVYWDVTFVFRDAEDLQEKMDAVRDGREGWRWSVRVTRRPGWLKTAASYLAEFSFRPRGDVAMMVPYLVGWKHRVRMPGRLAAWNGEVSGGFVEWKVPVDRVLRAEATWEVERLPGAVVGLWAVLLAAGGGLVAYTVRGRKRRRCRRCGAQSARGARFCTVCGEKLF